MARKTRRASRARPARRRSSRRAFAAVPRRSSRSAQTVRLVIETPAAAGPQMVPAHLGPGGGIVPLLSANINRKPKF